jgi:hypothetical protein
MTARLGAIRHIRQTAAERVCSDAIDEKIQEKFTLFSRAVVGQGLGAAAGFRVDIIR